MGTAERRNKEKEELRSLILDAAKELFIAKGIERTTIRNIADKIDYSIGTVYVYFKDKNEILFEINNQGFINLKKIIEPVMNLKKPIDQLYQMGKSYLEFALNNSQMYDLMFIMNAPIDYLEDKKNNADEWCEGQSPYNMLREVIKRCVKAKVINGGEEDIDSISFAYWGLVHGLAALAVKKRFCAVGGGDDHFIYSAYESFFKTVSNIK